MTAEIPLVGGDVNPVVRVGDTVRRPPQPSGVRALLQWYEQVSFDGAPRFLGEDESGREVLSFVEGDPAFAPVPAGDDVVAGIGRLLREAHDAQAGFVAPPGSEWARTPVGDAEVVAHLDLFWTNVVFREGRPAALIDWELAGPATRVVEVALAATYWASIRIDEQVLAWGLPLERRGERLRLLCDAYGLDAGERARLLPELIAYRRTRIERGEWRGTTLQTTVLANHRWVERHAAELEGFLA